MIKCLESPPIPAASKLIQVKLFADTKQEVLDDVTQMTIVDFPDGYDIEMGSSVMTASGELAFRKSNGTWKWV